MLLILIIFSLAFKAHASDINLHGTTTAVYGEEASFTCKLAESAGVVQVTWQRGLKPESLENLATYNRRFGQKVNDPFEGKVSFRESSLNSSSIILRNVTWEDENCYVCSFNAYPDGSKRKQICLKVEGILKMHKNRVPTSNPAMKGRQEVLSCSATGKPAPTITWDIPSNISSKDLQQTAVVSNSDRTFTSSSSITVEVPADWRGRVDCVLNKGMTGERREEFPFSSLQEEKVEESWSLNTLIIATLAIIICIIVVAAVVIHKRRLKRRPIEFTAV